MKLKTKLKRKRKEWMSWLFDNTDPVNGNINNKFEGIINHALEEHSNESISEERQRIFGKIMEWDTSGEMYPDLITHIDAEHDKNVEGEKHDE